MAYLVIVHEGHSLLQAFASAGLPLGPLNPLKSFSKHMVPECPYFPKMVPKVPISA